VSKTLASLADSERRLEIMMTYPENGQNDLFFNLPGLAWPDEPR
jgi:hypothetical protein